MGPKERIFKKSYAGELLAIAENDLVAARALATQTDVRPETTLMLAQQCVEKALKSALCALGKPIPMTHDLYAIVSRFDADNLPPHGYDLDDLTPYATIRRYEEGRFEITPDDIAAGITVCESVLKWCRQCLEASQKA